VDKLADTLHEDVSELYEELRQEFQSKLVQEREERLQSLSLLFETLEIWSKNQHHAAEETSKISRQLNGLALESVQNKISIQKLSVLLEGKRGSMPQSMEEQLRPSMEDDCHAMRAQCGTQTQMMELARRALDHHKVIATLMDRINYFNVDFHLRILEPVKEADQNPERWSSIDINAMPPMLQVHLERIETMHEKLELATVELVTSLGSIIQQLESERPGTVCGLADLDSKVGQFYDMHRNLEDKSNGASALICTLRILVDSGVDGKPTEDWTPEDDQRCFQEWIHLVKPNMDGARQECDLHERATSVLISVMSALLKDIELPVPLPSKDSKVSSLERIEEALEVDSNASPGSPAWDRADMEQISMLQPLEVPVLGDDRQRRPSEISQTSEALTTTSSAPCTPFDPEARFNFGLDEAVDDFMSVINESSDVELSHGQSKVFKADNKLLQSGKPGLTYCKSACLSDLDSHRAFVPWGSMVYGKEVCDGAWLKVQERFLPQKINGVTVLRPYFST
jgi:hypothetical protein